ncbi:hypothetical protein Q9295_12440 [Xinfangfangia sp. CPCC 101601]|uniref:Uncharacterized protein n=1 Tax=Pseudogemmobacter lacusdianii TaxID=3069608 RepID=A0ABU0W0A1_9RHOB|nr:hypothetical protein [Xinfangfangia sp. CPCC 101601]MDQ2067183.1 hypothetical protein [Xinfangfangia sp. CPCC 101601]
MQTFDEKVDTAVYAAFMALGLSVATNMELAIRLNDFITQEFQFVVCDDDGDGGRNACQRSRRAGR